MRSRLRRQRRPAFDAVFRRYRTFAGRFLSKLEHVRAVAARLEKYSANYLAPVKRATVQIFLRAWQVDDLTAQAYER